eukprot:267272-Karenia_brevis.AAC.1
MSDFMGKSHPAEQIRADQLTKRILNAPDAILGFNSNAKFVLTNLGMQVLAAEGQELVVSYANDDR